MGCIKRFSILFLLLVLFVAPFGSLLGETIPPTSKQLSAELTEISKSFNEILSNSSLTLMDIVEEFPQLLKRLADFEVKLVNFETKLENTFRNSEALEQDLVASMVELSLLRTQFEKVLSSVEIFQTSLIGIEDEVKRMKRRTNTGLVLSIVSALIAAAAALYSAFGN